MCCNLDLLSPKGFALQQRQVGKCYSASLLMVVLSQSRDDRKQENVTVLFGFCFWGLVFVFFLKKKV